MNLSQDQKQQHTQKQQLSKKLIQRFRTYHLSYSDLLNDIHKESEENVFLDIDRADSLQNTNIKSSDQLMGADIADYAKDNYALSLQAFLLNQLKSNNISRFLQHLNMISN